MNIEETGDHNYSPQPIGPDQSSQPERIKPRVRSHHKKQNGGGSGWQIFWGIVLAISVIINGLLFFGLIAMATLFAAGSGDLISGGASNYVEQTIVEGPGSDKIVIIRLTGIIDSAVSDSVRSQLETAAADKRVKAVILRVITPGGTVSASDQIHHEIIKFKKTSGKPIVSFMQSIAASGGYYSSVACDKIIAEPTAITGSIGVIMNTMVIQELLEEKLGINPVVIKSGPKKDWPSMFSETTDEQKAYLSEKLIMPAFERFVDLVTEGRSEQLDRSEVELLADGSIYGAAEAQEKGLIDKVGYLDEAIELTRQLASISNARVVEYQKPLSIYSVLGVQAKKPLSIDRNSLEQLAIPRLMYLWDAKQ